MDWWHWIIIAFVAIQIVPWLVEWWLLRDGVDIGCFVDDAVIEADRIMESKNPTSREQWYLEFSSQNPEADHRTALIDLIRREGKP